MKNNSNGSSLLTVRDLKVHFPIEEGLIFKKQVGAVRAVDGVSIDLLPGKTLGLVGESGCGKSTTARGIQQLIRPTSGSVQLNGEELTELEGEDLRLARIAASTVYRVTMQRKLEISSLSKRILGTLSLTFPHQCMALIGCLIASSLSWLENRRKRSKSLMPRPVPPFASSKGRPEGCVGGEPTGRISEPRWKTVGLTALSTRLSSSTSTTKSLSSSLFMRVCL